MDGDLVDAAHRLYRDLHAHPELSGAEKRTAGRFADALRQAGLKVDTGIGGHGVAGVLSNGDGPAVLLRAELDALPVAERTGLDYASTVPQAMHACGHDLHMAAAAGAAAYLSGCRDRWRGAILVIGQPAEETSQGAAAMLADGLYDRFGEPDAVMAQHTAPLPAGMLAHGTGLITAGSISLDVTIIGRGGHPATPHLCVDPVVIAATVVTRLQAIAAQHAGVGTVTVGTLRAGGHAGVIADEARLGLTLRALSEPVLQEMHDSVVRAIHGSCDSAGTPQPPTIRQAARTPVNYTDAELTARVRTAHEKAFGADRVAWWPPSLATEDFPLLGLGRLATVYWMLGVVGPQQWRSAGRTAAERFAALPTNHSSSFAPWPPLALPAGIRALAVAALSVMRA